MCQPPNLKSESEETVNKYLEEKEKLFSSLKKRAEIVSD